MVSAFTRHAPVHTRNRLKSVPWPLRVVRSFHFPKVGITGLGANYTEMGAKDQRELGIFACFWVLGSWSAMQCYGWSFRRRLHVSLLKTACASLTASMHIFKQHPYCLTYFLATAQESRQRKPRSSQFFNPAINSASKSERLKVASVQSLRLVQTSMSGHLTSQIICWKIGVASETAAPPLICKVLGSRRISASLNWTRKKTYSLQ